MKLSKNARAVLDLIEVPVFALKPDRRGEPVFSAFNAAACQITGLTAEAVMGRTALDVWPDELGETTYRWHRAVMHHARSRAYVIQLPLPSGPAKVRTHLRPVLDEDGRVALMLGTSELLDDEVPRAERDTILGLAAHELLAPLRNIRVLLDMAQDDPEPRLREIDVVLQTVQSVTERATHSARQLIAYCRSLRAHEELSQFGLQDLVEEMLDQQDPNRIATVKVDDAKLVGDRAATYVLLRTFLDRSLKELRPGLFVRITASATEGGQYEVTVADSARPLSLAEENLITDGTLRTGLGFGLYGARDLLSRRGGKLWFTRCDAGAELSFSLPGALVN